MTNNNNKDMKMVITKPIDEKKIGTFSDTQCNIGYHSWIDTSKGSVVCYICGKVLYNRNDSEKRRPKP